MTSLAVCTKCEEEERLETKQKEFELNQFKVIWWMYICLE